MITQTCSVSGQTFPIREEDLAFYEKMGVNPPTLCPDERARRRLAWKNERKLYRRQCDGSGEMMLSIFSPEYPGPVYSPAYYWSDAWQAADFGRDFDFNRPFFDQFRDLLQSVPQLGLILKDHDGSEYCHDAIRLKNCYLIFDGEQGRDCRYGETFAMIEDCQDFLFLEGSQLCYECTNVRNGYDLKYCLHCDNCSESWFLRDCIGCRDCFGCSNLFQKQYWIYNKPYTKEEYERFIAGFASGDYPVIEKLKRNAESFHQTGFVKYQYGTHNEEATGDHIHQCKDCWACFDSNQLRDCAYCTNMIMGANDCYDCHIWGNSTDWCVDCCGVGEGASRVRYSFYCCFGVESVDYSYMCWNNAKNLFGCCGLSQGEHFILNKNFIQQEYEVLSKKIIQHMKETGEWGEFFPASMSPFAYNETVAQEYYPLTREEALARGYRWREELNSPLRIRGESKGGYESKNSTTPGAPSYSRRGAIPDNISEVSDSICEQVLYCEESGKPYKIQKAELKFYRTMNLPIPRLHPDVRHRKRMALRNPRQLFTRQCQQCQQSIQTTYAPDRPEKVLCEECYLKVVN